MAGSHLTFTVPEFIENLEELQDAMDALPIARDLAPQITDLIYDQVAENFFAESTAFGRGWAPHAPATIAKYGPHPLLVLSGYMFRAATESGAPGNYEEVTDRTISVGLSTEGNPENPSGYNYSLVQQFGSLDGRIPPRPFFDIPQSTIREIELLAIDYYAANVEDFIYGLEAA